MGINLEYSSWHTCLNGDNFKENFMRAILGKLSGISRRKKYHKNKYFLRFYENYVRIEVYEVCRIKTPKMADAQNTFYWYEHATVRTADHYTHDLTNWLFLMKWILWRILPWVKILPKSLRSSFRNSNWFGLSFSFLSKLDPTIIKLGVK